MRIIDRIAEVGFFLLVVLTGIVFSPVILLFWIWKFFVQIIVLIFYKNLNLTFLTVLESYLYASETQEDFYHKPKRCILLYSIIEGQLGQDEVKERVQKSVLEAKGPDGSYVFTRLRYQIFKKFGYAFFGLAKNFDIANHIREVEISLTEESVNDFVVNRNSAPLQKEFPLWEILLVPRYNGENKTLLFFRTHHLLMDGFSVVHFCRAICDTEQFVTLEEPKITEAILRKQTCLESLQNFYKRTIALPRKYLLERSIRNHAPIYLSHDEAYNKKTAKIPLQNFKDLKRRANISLTEAVLSAISFAYSSGCSQIEEVNWITTKSVFPLPSSGKTIGNHFYAAEIDLPVGSMTLEERIRKCQAELLKTRTSVSPLVNGMLLKFGTIFPIAMFSKYFMQRTAYVYISNTPGPPMPIRPFGRLCHDVFFTMIPTDVTQIFVCLMSYQGDVTFCLSAVARIFKNKEKFDEFVDHFETGLNAIFSSVHSFTNQFQMNLTEVD